MQELKIGGRVIPLVFNWDSWSEMEREVCALSKLRTALDQRKSEKLTSDAVDIITGIIRVLGNQGLELNGQPRDLTDKWLRQNLRPREMTVYRDAVVNEIDGEMMSEENKRDPEAERDLVLEEINEKKTEAS